MKNLGLRAVALCIAFVLWYFVTTNISSITLKVPVELANLPKQKILLSSKDLEAQVKISGPNFLVSTIQTKMLRFRHELPQDVGERYVVNLKEDQLEIPSALQILSIEPRQFELEFERSITSSVPVEVTVTGNLLKGLSLEEVGVFPRTVNVSGPASEISSLKRVKSYPVDLGDFPQTGHRIIPLRQPSANSKLEVDQVKVTVLVSGDRIRRVLSEQPVELRGGAANDVDIAPRFVSINLEGPQAIISNLDQASVETYIEVNSLEKGALGAKSVEVAPIAGVTIVDIKPSKVVLSEKAKTPAVRITSNGGKVR